jgi:hypothetical protein
MKICFDENEKQFMSVCVCASVREAAEKEFFAFILQNS